MVSSKDIAVACVDSLMHPADPDSSDEVIIYTTQGVQKKAVLNEEL
jgi:hypothetical protein